ncbi:MAG: PmoA family protein [Gemmataceae bacterium]|nr:PmoA family protein [Gemmataceae bacterium]
MMRELSRRRFLQVGVATTAGISLTSLAGGAAPAAPTLTTYQDGPQVWVRWGDRVLTCYRAHPMQKYPYLYPLAGPLTGVSLTTESGLPWPHHRSLFLGCDRVNGGNFWQGPLASGQILSSGPKLGPATPGSAQILDQCDWRLPGQPPLLLDERQLTVTVVSPRLWCVDAWIRLTARQPVHVAKSNHSLFAVRAAGDITPAGGGSLVNSEGAAGEAATFGREAAWCDFAGRRRGLAGDVVEGVALMDHPQNPWSPCRWFTRDYGFMSPTPFNWLDDAGWRLAAGQAVTLRYRVVLHAGDAQDAGLAGTYKTWSAMPA